MTNNLGSREFLFWAYAVFRGPPSLSGFHEVFLTGAARRRVNTWEADPFAILGEGTRIVRGELLAAEQK